MPESSHAAQFVTAGAAETAPASRRGESPATLEFGRGTTHEQEDGMVKVRALRDHAVGGRVMVVGGEYDLNEPLAIERERLGFVEILKTKAVKAEAGPAENKAAAPAKARKAKK